MFFVFGPSGQIYRGGPENLAQIAAVRRVERPQALRTRGMDIPPDAAAAPAPQDAKHAPAVNLRLQDAVAAYVQTGKGPQRRRRRARKPRSAEERPTSGSEEEVSGTVTWPAKKKPKPPD